jgi:hypothetical protein
MTALDVGLWLTLSTRQVERLAKLGRIPSITLPTGDVVFERAELLTWFGSLRDRRGEVANAS